MQRIIRFFEGSVRVEVSGSYPERFLNLCARNGIGFRNMENLDTGVFRIDMAPSEYLKIRGVAKKAMCRVHIVSKSGLPFIARKVRGRHLLIAGSAVFCVAAWVFTSFVWTVSVDGFEGLDREKLMAYLEEEGLRRGVSVSSVDVEALRNNILIRMPELSYIYVNFNGAEARVIARERKAPPEILREDEPCDIIADKDGIIEEITVKTGTASVSRGDTVMRGQILASGYVTGREGTTVITHADAEITARTWTHMSARMQKRYNEKVYTGSEKSCYTIILFGHRIKLYPNSRISYAKCDKIIKTNEISLSDKIVLPIALEKATYREFSLSKKSIREEVAYEVMGETLARKFSEKKDCEVLETKLITSADENLAYATLQAECVEKIGKERKILRDG